MSWTKRLLFHAIMWGSVLVVANLACLLAVRMLSGVNPLDRVAYLEYKSRFVKSVDRSSYAHPYFGQAFTAHASVDDVVANGEPVLFAVPEAMPADPIKVLILGGSVASHFSMNRAEDQFEDQGAEFDKNDIFERALRTEFASDRFVVYNGALPGGKQPQQLFKLYYLHLLGQSYDIVINLDGFNEVALPFADNIPVGNQPIFPRSYSQLLRSTSVDSRCVPDSNRFATSVSPVPAIELAKLLYTRNCVETLEGSGDDPLNLAELANFTPKAEDEWFIGIEAIWNRSSGAIDAFARLEGFDYLHVLQPNQYLESSKALSQEERDNYVGYAVYGDPIRRFYGQLDLGATGVRQTLDLRFMFKDEAQTLYRDQCCHLNNRGQLFLAQAIIRGKREVFERHLRPQLGAGRLEPLVREPVEPTN